jgi:hypothetical protein
MPQQTETRLACTPEFLPDLDKFFSPWGGKYLAINIISIEFLPLGRYFKIFKSMASCLLMTSKDAWCLLGLMLAISMYLVLPYTILRRARTYMGRRELETLLDLFTLV